MSFLGKFTFNHLSTPAARNLEGYNIFQWIFDYNHGQFKDHDNKIIIMKVMLMMAHVNIILLI